MVLVLGGSAVVVPGGSPLSVGGADVDGSLSPCDSPLEPHAKEIARSGPQAGRSEKAFAAASDELEGPPVRVCMEPEYRRGTPAKTPETP
jgi:hypothetical protein